MSELLKIVEAGGLEPQTSDKITERFSLFFMQAKEWKEKAESLVVTDASQKDEMLIARKTRIELRNLRTSADKTRKALKEDSIRYGRVVQSIYNKIEEIIKPLESHLEKQEKFVEIQREIKIEKLREKREADFPYEIPVGVNLGELSEEEYKQLVFQHKAIADAYAKEEADRIAKVAAEKAEQERVQAENEKLRKEARDKDMKWKAEIAEREEVEAKLRAEARDKDMKWKAEIAEAKLIAEREKVRAEREKVRAEREAELTELPSGKEEVKCPKCGHIFHI